MPFTPSYLEPRYTPFEIIPGVKYERCSKEALCLRYSCKTDNLIGRGYCPGGRVYKAYNRCLFTRRPGE